LSNIPFRELLKVSSLTPFRQRAVEMTNSISSLSLQRWNSRKLKFSNRDHR